MLPLLRLFGRLSVLAVATAILVLVGLQYWRILQRNVALASSLRDMSGEIAVLKVKKSQQERDVARLSDPRGSIPEIHERLHLVAPHEAIIYLKRKVPAPVP